MKIDEVFWIEVELEKVKIVWEKEKWYLQSKGTGQRSLSAKSQQKVAR